MKMIIGRRRFLSVGATSALIAGAGASAADPIYPAAPETEWGKRADELLHTDWSWRSRYRDVNAAARDLPQDKKRVVFMGDSITKGWPDSHPEFFADNGFIGRGIGGQSTPQMLVRFMEDVVALQPQAVHIMAGTNDIAQNTGPYDPIFTTNMLTAMATLAKANHIKVILASVTPAFDYPWRKGLAPNLRIPELNTWIKGYAASQGFGYADYFSVMTNGQSGMTEGLSYDTVHPNRKGYEVMEPVCLAAVKSTLAHRL